MNRTHRLSAPLSGFAWHAARGPGVGDPMTANPIWFGPRQRPRFGWFHEPDSGRARSGVVLCPPIGDEERRVYLTFRKLAESLAMAGLAVLRFSYDGTGDSAGTLDDPDRVEAWTATISDAVDVVRAAGVERVAVVGMRLGATLATHAAGTMARPLDAVVLWDPCVTGREFLRHQQVLLTTIPGQPPANEEGVDTPGYHFSASLVEELRSLEIVPVANPETRTLVLARRDRPAPGRLDRALGSSPADRLDALGQDELLDVPPLSAVIPWKSIEAITTWLSEAAGSTDVPITAPEAGEAIVGTDGLGRPVRERTLRLGEIGLFAIATEPEGGGSGPWMMFVNVATEHHIGPGRLWVELARDWARHGIRSLRFDVSGVGDSPVHPGQTENITYAREWLDDLPALAAGVSPDDPSDTVFIGLCSGGYGALESGMAVGARGAYVFNPALSSESMNKSSKEADPRRRAFRPLPVPLVNLARNHGRTAWWIWRTYRQFAVWQAPMAVPAAAVRSGLDVFLICGEDDAQPLREVLFWRAFGEGRLVRTGRFELAVVPAMDHVLLLGEGRRTASRLLTRRVLERFGSSNAAAAVNPPRGGPHAPPPDARSST
jgi:alpha-beta hydrolase superfamily lysophospholipase